MQYVLTQEEFDTLRTRRQTEFKLDQEKLQKLCTNIAEKMPVARPYAQTSVTTPWGCILTAGRQIHYCDLCPVSEICPHEHKQWSK